MANIRPKTRITQKLSATTSGHARADVGNGRHSLVIDEPAVRHGTDQGMTPMETMLAALIGCTNVITRKIAAAMDIEIGALAIRLEAEADIRGAHMIEEIALPYPALTLFIDIATGASESELTELRRRLAAFCPVAKMFRAAGTEITEVWTVQPA